MIVEQQFWKEPANSFIHNYGAEIPKKKEGSKGVWILFCLSLLTTKNDKNLKGHIIRQSVTIAGNSMKGIICSSLVFLGNAFHNGDNCSKKNVITDADMVYSDSKKTARTT